MMDARAKREIQVLRRILFSCSIEQLEQIRARFVEQEEFVTNGDDEIRDYIDWLVRRQEILL